MTPPSIARPPELTSPRFMCARVPRPLRHLTPVHHPTPFGPRCAQAHKRASPSTLESGGTGSQRAGGEHTPQYHGCKPMYLRPQDPRSRLLSSLSSRPLPRCFQVCKFKAKIVLVTQAVSSLVVKPRLKPSSLISSRHIKVQGDQRKTEDTPQNSRSNNTGLKSFGTSDATPSQEFQPHFSTSKAPQDFNVQVFNYLSILMFDDSSTQDSNIPSPDDDSSIRLQISKYSIRISM
jgi:hypothetical protein